MAEELRLRLRGGPDAAAVARRELACLDSELDPSTLETLHLLVTELVSNAVKHAAAPSVAVDVSLADGAVRAEVSDPGPGFDPAGTGVPRDNNSGWGLFLVQQLAHRWGVAEDQASNRVWFELRAA
jgi:anti-sigma regulatory factor (Ser/Thr protein kinase)